MLELYEYVAKSQQIYSFFNSKSKILRSVSVYGSLSIDAIPALLRTHKLYRHIIRKRVSISTLNAKSESNAMEFMVYMIISLIFLISNSSWGEIIMR